MPSSSSNGATGSLARFASGLRYDDLRESERRATRRHMLDTLGACIAGTTTDITKLARTSLAALGAAQQDALNEAYLWGAAAHGLEVDDGYRAGSVHPGTVVLPALLASARRSAADGRALLAGVAVGYEVVTRLAEAIHPRARQRGFHNTPIVGVFGAAAAAGSLRGLDTGRMAHALGLAASSASGLFAFLHGGGEVKRLHGGAAARDGLLAARLAEDGMTGPAGVLEGIDGFFQAYAGIPTPPGLSAGLIDRSEDLNVTRCYLKLHSCCRHIHPAIDAVLELAARERFDSNDIERVACGTYSIAAAHGDGGASTMAEAQLSYRFCVATALRFGRVAPTDFHDTARADPLTHSLAERIHVFVDDACEQAYPRVRPAHVVITLKNGRSFERTVDEPRGSARHPLSDNEVTEKFMTLASPTLGHARAHLVAAWIADVDRQHDIRSLIPLITPGEP